MNRFQHGVSHTNHNFIERSHQEIKQRYYLTLGIGASESAKQFCQAHDEARNLLRPQRCITEVISLSK